MKKTLLALPLLFTALPALADWTLDAEQSNISFVTTKNTSTSEIQQFRKFSGTLTPAGEVRVEIDLSSVDTAIEIRDQRMREKLFEVADFPTAVLTASIDPEELKQLDEGEFVLKTVPATLELHGQQKAIELHLAVTGLDDGAFLATATQPVLISAADFKLDGGVAWLQEVAKLANISLSVPVSFSMHFTGN